MRQPAQRRRVVSVSTRGSSVLLFPPSSKVGRRGRELGPAGVGRKAPTTRWSRTAVCRRDCADRVLGTVLRGDIDDPGLPFDIARFDRHFVPCVAFICSAVGRAVSAKGPSEMSRAAANASLTCSDSTAL